MTRRGKAAITLCAIPLVLGAKWLPTVRLIQLLGLSGWLSCIYSIFYTALLATGRSRDQLRIHAYLALATKSMRSRVIGPLLARGIPVAS